MSIQFGVLVVPFVVSAVLTAGLTLYGLGQLRTDSGNKTVIAFVGIVLSVTIWSVSRAFQFLFTSETITQLWITGIYVGVGGSSISVFAFAMAFTGQRNWLTRKRFALLSIVPVVAVLIALTNQYHQLFWTGEFTQYETLAIIEREFQPAFYVYFAYVQILYLAGVYVLLRMAVRSAEVYRRQTIAFLIGLITPLILGILFAIDAIPFVPRFVDPTPLGFAVTGVALGYAIFRYQMLDLVPVARDTVIESMRDGYVVLDTENRIVDLNHAAMDILETDDGVIGGVIEESLPECAAFLEESDEEERSESEFSMIGTGTQRFLVGNLSPIYDGERLIGRLLLLRDVTDRRAIQQRYQALIENSSDLIFVVEPDGEITYASPSITNVTGTQPEDIIGQNALEMIHHEDRDEFEAIVSDLADNPGEKVRHEYRSMDSDGDRIYLEASVWNLLDNPFVEGIVVNAREITERKEREQEVREKNEQLQQANDQLEQFASVISHDLRNPINVAKGHAQIAEETGNQESFEKIEDSLNRMEAIIDDVLTLAREGETIGETEQVSLKALAEEAWGHVATDDATLQIATDASFQADPDRLLQLFENCFRNAHEHVGNDVTVTVGSGDSYFYIEDDGPGIPAEKRETVLESGYTTNQDGTGLGLSIVQGIAEAHDWSVQVTEGSTGGARFEFDGIGWGESQS